MMNSRETYVYKYYKEAIVEICIIVYSSLDQYNKYFQNVFTEIPKTMSLWNVEFI
jgi:hypothetical protein